MGSLAAPGSEEASSVDRAGTEPLQPYDPPRIGPYRLLGRLGQGGMGTVYLAEAPTGRPVAVKVVKAEFTVDEGFAVRFHSEVANARRVASFCTAQVLDNGNAVDGRPYMVTEYIAGTPLSAQISRYGALEAGTLHGVALGVAAALAAIHVAGLVHRDLKPANVILSMSGPRVIDFGIARALDATQGVTKSGELLGSPGWWAPEQVRGEEISPAADVFAWGCLVAYAGNGRHPYGRGDMLTLASRVLTGRPDLGTLPAPLDRLVRLATDPDPLRRPSAQDLLIALVGGDIARPGPAPSPASADPPTLVATELLSESWEPPANVAAAVTASASGSDGGSGGGPGSAFDSRLEGAADDGADTDDTQPGLSLPGLAYHLRAASHAEAPGAPSGPEADPAEAAGPGAASPPEGVSPAEPPSGTPASPLPATLVPATSVLEDPPLPADDTRPQTGTTAATMPGLTQEQQARGGSRKWLLPVLTVLAGLLVTGGVLAMVVHGRSQVRATGVAAATPAAPETDVGRRFTTGSFIEDAQFVVPRPARCGLTTYEGATPSRGRFCVIAWTLMNPGGTSATPPAEPPVLVDDRGGEHELDQSSTAVPETLYPGDKIDGVFVYDVPPARDAAVLKLRISDTRTIEVRL
ncbi:serine/threonine protein kinase [Sphaerisporangium sp. NBC_01403]|uniref:serine/threonine protein kinase n=1 Tax=Sphaerisporangium sp. NBC_01403 TaxID=2903599 RepID=UPI003251F5CF